MNADNTWHGAESTDDHAWQMARLAEMGALADFRPSEEQPPTLTRSEAKAMQEGGE